MKLKLSLAVGAAAALVLTTQSPALAADTLVGGASEGTTVARPIAPPSAKAGTAVTVGEPVIGGSSCGTTGAILQVTSTGPSYTVPGAGVITGFSYAANAIPGAMRALFFTPGPAVGHFTLVGKTAANAVAPGMLNSWATRVPVPAGTTLGLQVSDADMNCGIETPNVNDLAAFQNTFNPDVQTDLAGTPIPGVRAGVSAVWEPDTDRDGFGDVSQDACPQSATTQAACPAPDTKPKGKHPVTSNGRGTVKIKFKSTIPGSTFTCAVDNKAAKRCSSPFKKRFSLGRHKVVITAISPAGIADPKPLKVTLQLRAG